jgi:hypothetical protein
MKQAHILHVQITQFNTYALQSSLSFKQRLLITKTVKSHCKKHVLNVAAILNVLNQ